MTPSSSDLSYAHESARFALRRARTDLDQTLEQLAVQLETAAARLRQLVGQRHVPVPVRAEAADHELGMLHARLWAGVEHLGGVGAVWADARRELDELDALLVDESPA
jgi:hypothetical protein